MVPRIVLAVLFCLLILAFSVAAEELPKELTGCKAVKLWQFDKDAEGWLPDHNIADFEVSKGVLRFRTAGFDPWIITQTPGGSQAESHHFRGINMRSWASGINQIYFATDKSPYPAANGGCSCSDVGDNRFRFYEIDMSRQPNWRGKLTMLRIDPINGGNEGGASVEIEWIALYQKPATITIDRPSVTAAGNGLRIRMSIANAGGEPLSGGLRLRVAGKVKDLPALAPGKNTAVSIDVPKTSSRTVKVTGSCAGKPVLDISLLSPPSANGSRAISNKTSRLNFIGDRGCVSAALSALIRGKAVLMGALQPLATLAYRDNQGVFHYEEIAADSVRLTGSHAATLSAKRKVNGGTATFKWAFTLPQGKPEGTMSCEMASSAPIDVLRFEGSRLLAGDRAFGASKTHALFPGLEYLEGDEKSSSPDHVGPKFFDRRVPHPYKVTVPVMAVESGGAVVGLSWDPLAQWAPERSLPSAQFESPNRSAGSKNHLLALFAPSIPEYLEENYEIASRPYRLKAGELLRLSASFFARKGTITDVVPNWLAAHGTPKAPPVAHGVDGTIDLCFKGLTESLYSVDNNGWKNHIGLGMGWSPDNTIASAIVAESLRKGDPGLMKKCRIDPDTQLASYSGTTMDWFSERALKQVEALIGQQSDDGGLSYHEDEQMKKKIKEIAAGGGVDASSLGKEGTTNPGYIAIKLMGVLSYALKTGNEVCTEAGLRALAKMNSFTIPSGASTWEVPFDTPEILSAGYCVDANVLGYQLTGDDTYLQKAKFWAYTGLPFVYLWVPPVDPVVKNVLVHDEQGEGKNSVWTAASEFYDNTRRHVNPGATIAEFGTSFYVVSWFGQPVQWCGQLWADAVRRYLRVRSDPVLESVADMVFASITQQQAEKGLVAGCYTDVWGIEPTGNSPVFLWPSLILDYAYALKGEKQPTSVDSIGFDLASGRSILNTYACVESCRSTANTLEAELKHHAGQDLYSCISRADRPASVRTNGEALAESADLKTAGAGWQYDTANCTLHVKYRPDQRGVKLRVTW